MTKILARQGDVVQWTGNNTAEVSAFLGNIVYAFSRDGKDGPKIVRLQVAHGVLVVVRIGDWIVRHGPGVFEHYPAAEFTERVVLNGVTS